MDEPRSIRDITLVLGPLWTEDFIIQKRVVNLTYDNKYHVTLIFDETFKKFRFAHDVPVNAPLIDVRYMNEFEAYYYGIYLITSCQKPFRDYCKQLREEWLDR